MNSITLAVQSGSSPFDSIRRMDESGQEYWYARELQKILGYRQWKEFQKVIDSAIENLETVTDDVTQHVASRRGLSSVSNPVPLQDYNLSRLACYHIALCCDSRGKVEVKLAKHYFATKTCEAEVISSDSFKTLTSGQLVAIRDALLKPASVSPEQMSILTQGIPPAVVAMVGALTNDQYVKLYMTLRNARVPQDIQDQKDAGVFTKTELKIADKTIERFEAMQPVIDRKWHQAIGGTIQKALEGASNN